MLLAGTIGCNSEKGSQPQPDTHQHADEATQFTLFSETIEFFGEHTPLIAGEESEFLIHITDLSTFKPYRTGNVTILIDGVSVTSGAPHSPGIFEVPFIPKKAGAFHAEFIFQSGDLTETTEGHIHIYQDHDEIHAEDGGAAGHTHEAETEGEITFLKEQAWNNDFMVTRITPTPFASVIHTSGEILAMPAEKKNVAANGRGMVLFANRTLVQGSSVSKGQHLFTISSKTLLENNFELQYQEYLNSYQKSRSEYERHKKLFENGVIPEREFITTKSNFLADSLRYYNLKANASSEGLKVIASETGTIHELIVSEGQFINVGDIMVIISSNQTLLIRADLSQQFYNKLSEIETANFRPAYTDEVYSIEEMNGRLLAAGSSVAENDHYLPVIFELKNDGRLLEGAFAEIYLKAKEKASCIVAPSTAITEEQGEYYVYVQVTGETYSKRAVTPGENDGKQVEIIGGLNTGDRVVTKGMMLVKAASMVTGVVGHGHSH